MATKGNVAIGDIIEVETAAGSGSFFKLGEATNIPPPNQTADSVDYTHMESPGGVREFGPGLIDPGDQSIELNYLNGDSAEVFVLAWMAARETRATRITVRNGKKYTYPAFPTGWSPTGQVGDKRSATLALKVAGQVVLS